MSHLDEQQTVKVLAVAEEDIVLEPLSADPDTDSSRRTGTRRSQKRGRPKMIDRETFLSMSALKKQLEDTTDIVGKLHLAPISKKLMRLQETAEVKDLLACQTRLRTSVLIEKFNLNKKLLGKKKKEAECKRAAHSGEIRRQRDWQQPSDQGQRVEEEPTLRDSSDTKEEPERSSGFTLKMEADDFGPSNMPQAEQECSVKVQFIVTAGYSVHVNGEDHGDSHRPGVKRETQDELCESFKKEAWIKTEPADSYCDDRGVSSAISYVNKTDSTTTQPGMSPVVKLERISPEDVNLQPCSFEGDACCFRRESPVFTTCNQKQSSVSTRHGMSPVVFLERLSPQKIARHNATHVENNAEIHLEATDTRVPFSMLPIVALERLSPEKITQVQNHTAFKGIGHKTAVKTSHVPSAHEISLKVSLERLSAEKLRQNSVRLQTNECETRIVPTDCGQLRVFPTVLLEKIPLIK